MAQKASKKLLTLIHGYCRIESNDMNIIDAIINIIFEYHKIATWSKKFKGQSIALIEDDSKAICSHEHMEGHSVRADFCIERGQIVSWELECYQTSWNCYFYGVVSSKQETFNECPSYGRIEGAYGLDDMQDTIYLGAAAVYTKNLDKVEKQWNKPSFPHNIAFTLKIIADWKEKQCKLTFYYEGEKLNESNEYTMLLPELDDKYVWYPCATPFNTDAYCIIRYAY